MINIPFPYACISRLEFYDGIENILYEMLGNSTTIVNDVYRRRWVMTEWAQCIEIEADEETEFFLALKYGVM